MDPQGTLANLIYQIRRKLWIPHVFNPGLLDCAVCGKRMGRMREEIMRKKTNGVPLCRSCFELVLKMAAQTPDFAPHSTSAPPGTRGGRFVRRKVH